MKGFFKNSGIRLITYSVGLCDQLDKVPNPYFYCNLRINMVGCCDQSVNHAEVLKLFSIVTHSKHFQSRESFFTQIYRIFYLTDHLFACLEFSLIFD
jgi:hypothetical protein